MNLVAIMTQANVTISYDLSIFLNINYSSDHYQVHKKSFFVFSIRSKIFRESYHCIFSLIKFYDYKVYGTHGDVCLGNNRNERGLFIQQEFDLSPVCSKE